MRVMGFALLLAAAASSMLSAGRVETGSIDHSYRELGQVLRQHVEGPRVDYARLRTNRAGLDAVVESLGTVTASDFDAWSREQQIAYLINAYNAFTLQAIVDHYPIDGGWLSFLRWAPRNSIKQIDGVWTVRRWAVAGTSMTLDQIEHEVLRVRYDEPRIHFAINCASISCPPLRREPYVAERLDRQLVIAARDYLASDEGLQVEGQVIRASSLFDWFGDDFVARYAQLVDAPGSERDRAVLGVVAKYGPAEASRLAQSGNAQLRFLRYDWGLNDAQK